MPEKSNYYLRLLKLIPSSCFVCSSGHPNADRLYVLQVDTGKDVRQIVAGVRNAYTPEQLINRRIILIANMEPAVIRGEVSNGMLLAASDANGMALLAPDKDMALGSIVK